MRRSSDRGARGNSSFNAPDVTCALLMTSTVTETPVPLARAAPDLSRANSTAAVVAIGIFAALSCAASWSSEGFLEADGCTHYLYARFALREPHFLVNVWGRPLFTALYALPSAYAGLAGAHVLSLALAVGCGLVAQ